MRNNKAMIAIIGLLLLISIGYTLLTSNLSINGTTKIDGVRWDVFFADAHETTNTTVYADYLTPTPYSAKVREIRYDVSLNNPGDVFEFSVDIVNDGTLDAMLDSKISTIKIGDGPETMISPSTLPSYLNYSITYSNGEEIQPDDLLNADNKKNIIVRVEYKNNLTGEQIAEATGKTITFKLELNYKQAIH